MAKEDLPSSRPPTPVRSRTAPALLLTAGTATLAAYLLADRSALARTDRLAWTTSAFLLFFWGLCAWFARRTSRAEVRSQTSDFSGQESVRRSNSPTAPTADLPASRNLQSPVSDLPSPPTAPRLPPTACRFPLLFLTFLIPFPTAVEAGIEKLLQHGSAEAAYWLFRISGMTLFRDGTEFHLPGFNLEVAPECSGIHSTLVLFITSLVAGQMFLHTSWKRWALALFVIPLALLRNGFRVVVIGSLCVYVSPDMIHSYIHRQGGPIFFALSLVPFVAVLGLLWRSERESVGGRTVDSGQ